MKRSFYLWTKIKFYKSLKVDGNKKLGGSGRRWSFSLCLALWRSRVICNLNCTFCVKILFPFPLATALSRRIGKAGIKCCF
jgi:hypothetical protein